MRVLIGVVIGLLLPLLADWALFGTPIPCEVTVKYEDGSTIQHCEVRG